MKKLKLSKENTLGYDVEHVTKPVIFIKGVGRRCVVCSRHITGRKDKSTCSSKCNSKIWRIKNRDNCDDKSSVRARISVKKTTGKDEHRVLSIYLKKGVSRKVKINSSYGELWHILEMIEKFRNNPLEIKNETS